MTFCKEGWTKQTVRNIYKTILSTLWDLAINQNLLLRKSRLVIPTILQQEILDRLHERHQDIAKYKEKDKQTTITVEKYMYAHTEINPSEPLQAILLHRP